MKNLENQETEKEFLSHPEFVKHYTLLQDIGVIEYIDSLDREIRNYKKLFAGALDIFNRITISEIMDVAVRHISDRFLPSFIVFIWKPLQNREDITIKSYKNYKPVELNIQMEGIKVFEPLFQKYPHPLSYDFLASEMGQNEILKSFDELKPALIIPILGPSGLYGMVLLGPKILEDGFSQAELLFIKELMSFVSQAIQNHLHYERTLRDVKTGLYNNGFFMSRLSEEISRTKRIKSSASIIMMDVDKFKDFNDTYGHLAGDRVLESLAITIKQGVRTEDIPSRFGGEEFTVLLPDTGKEHAWQVSERLRTMVEEMKVVWEPQLPKVTISIGIFTFDKDNELTVDGIISRADEALYMSKELGRNRSTAWGAGLFGKIKRLKTSSGKG